MPTSVPFRLGVAALVVLGLPALTSVSRCAGQEPGGATDGPGLLRKIEEARRAAERRASARVLAGIARAPLLALRDPDDAYQLLQGIRDEVLEDADISEPCRRRLESRLEWALVGIVKSGTFLKRLECERLVRKAELRARLERLRFLIGKWNLGPGPSPGPE